MFEVGFSELLLIFALALVVLGPERLPKLAQQVGRWVGRARAMARQFRDQLDEEAHNLETKMNIDPGVDTSLDPKPEAQPSPAAANVPVPAAPPEPEEDYYPPDHHMHSSHRDAAAAEANAQSAPEAAPEAATTATASGQAEFDLTTPRDEASRSTP